MRAALYVTSLGLWLGLSGCLFKPDPGDRISCRQDQDCPGTTWCGGVARLEGPDCDQDPDLWTSHRFDDVCSFLYCIDEDEGEACGEEGNRCEYSTACIFMKGYEPTQGQEYYLHHCLERPVIGRASECADIELPYSPEPRPDCDENENACVLVFEMFRYEEEPPFRCVPWGELPAPPPAP